MKKHAKSNPLLNNNHSTSSSVRRSEVNTLRVENDEAQNRFLIFSQRDTRVLILKELNDRDFLTFGRVCKAFFVYMMLDPRFNVLKPSFRLKLDHPNFHYELIYRELMAKYQHAAMHKSAMFMRNNMRTLDISPWRNQVIHCFEALYNGVTASRMTSVSRMVAINGIQAIKKCLLLVMPRSALDFSGCLLSLETVENSDSTDPIVDALRTLLRHETHLDATQKATFHLCCQDMNTSFFADFSVLLESVQFYYQYLDAPHAQRGFFNQNTQIAHHREVQQTANRTRLFDNIRTRIFGTSLDGHGRMLVVGSILLVVNLGSLLLTIFETPSPNDSPHVKRPHQVIHQWVSLVSRLLLFIFAMLLVLKQRSENRLRELESNPPAPEAGPNHFVALEMGNEQRDTNENPSVEEEAGLPDDHQTSSQAKKNH